MLRNENKKLQVINRGLMLLSLGLVGVVGVQAWWLGQAMETRPIGLPPDLRNGAVVRGNEKYPEDIYTFAVTKFQRLNRWREDGEKEYAANIQAASDYLTPRFREYLVDDHRQRVRGGELQERTRALHLVGGRRYRDDAVKVQGRDEWVVYLEVELIETIEDAPVKRVMMWYPLRVVRYEVDFERNPWGLALDGFGEEGPRRLEELH